MKKTLLAAAVAATLGLAGASAQALTLYYDAYGGFVAPPPPDGMGIWGSTVQYGGYTDPDGNRGQVAWGTATGSGGDYSGQSYMSINDNNVTKYAPGDVQPIPLPRSSVVANAAGYTTFGDLTHFNFPITPAGDGKSWVNVNYELDLYANASDPEGARLYSVNLGPFILDTWETLNSGTCPNAASAGTTYPTLSGTNTFASNGTPLSTCDDAHAFGPTSTAAGTFTDAGVNYAVFVQGFYDAQGNLTGTFWPGENGSSTAYVGFRIETVPEPGSMALLGLGLAGLGLIRRRRNQA